MVNPKVFGVKTLLYMDQFKEHLMCALPSFAPGSFQRSDCKSSCPTYCGDNCAEVTIFWPRTVYMFWPKVEAYFENGYISGYKIHEEAKAEGRADGISMSKKLYLNNNRNYTITLKAAMENGYAPNKTVIYIPRKSEAPAAPAYVAAIALNSSTVHVKWQHIEEGGKQLPATYTVFWCKGSDQCIYKSDSDLYSKIVPNDVKSTVIHVSPTEGDTVFEYWYSVSANVKSNDSAYISSGMVGSECIHKPNSGLSPPELNKSALEEPNTIVVVWTSIKCEMKNDAIIYYEIWFCEGQPEKEDTCQAGTKKEEIANGNETRHKITNDVKADSLYLVWAVSVSATGKSAESKQIKIFTSSGVSYSSGEIAGIAVAGTFVALFVFCGIFFVARKWGRSVCSSFVTDYPIHVSNDDQNIELIRISYNYQ